MTNGRRDFSAPGYNPVREHFVDTGDLVGEARIRQLLGKTVAIESPDELAARMAREDFATRTDLPVNNTGETK